jgi:hypothetical protein
VHRAKRLEARGTLGLLNPMERSLWAALWAAFLLAGLGIAATAHADCPPVYLSGNAPILSVDCGPVVYNGSSSATLTLPSVAWRGTVIDLGPGAVTLAGIGGVTVNGSTSGVTLIVGSGGQVSGDPAGGWWFAGPTGSIAGSGTVTSVGLAAPNWFTVSGSPVVTAGTITLSGTSEPANQVLASPNGSAGAPSFRTLVTADIPTGTSGGTIPLLNGNLTLSGADNFTGTFAIGGFSLSLGGNTTLPIPPASTQCLHMTSAGAITTTGSDCGSGSGAVSSVTGSGPITASPTTGAVGLSFSRVEASKTASYSVLSSDNNTDFDNAGASAAITFTLPAWSAGLSYCFATEAAETVTIQAANGNFIVEAGVETASGGTAQSTMQYSNLCIVAKTSAIWQIDRHIGGWTLT